MLKLQRILQLTSLLLFWRRFILEFVARRGQKVCIILFLIQPENNPKAQPRSSAVAELFVF